MSIPCDMLLHPELLTNEQLIYIIQERHLKVNMTSLNREELLDIFHHFCLPYGQRRHRDSGRGKLLNKQRPPSPEKIKFNTFSSPPSRKLNMSDADRLKPPPDLLSGHMKRIKLDTPLLFVNKDERGCKRRMSVDSSPPRNICPPPKKERKLITWP